MKEQDIDSLRLAIEGMHGGKAKFVESVPVVEKWEGKTVWDGVVNVFDLTGHPEAKRAYAWSEPIAGSDNRQFFAVLNIPPVKSPLTAVKASIVERHRRRA